ncbi:hypothetical protein KDD30_05205 [Photobacterium sp. GJ3]|uniref:hypothetical protein n=1 Tax=Photobacterium sp. GJ3 TaxID=2829502 RepID=UPI001B8C0282|nr:hypothetical protein [Photobacterium sp. GJ3]QUJ68513.1 hypothetical protein KDD30_05205 [Photobacterium sp. GJ3]
MNLDILLEEISSSLSRLSVESRVNHYNLVAARLGEQQYKVTFSETLNTEAVTHHGSQSGEQNAGVQIEPQEQSIDDILLKAIELSSRNNRLVTLMNARLDLERMIIKGGR